MTTATVAEPHIWYATANEDNGIPHVGNVETWGGADYIVTCVVPLEHGPRCFCGDDPILVAYWPLAWEGERTAAWRHQQRHRESVQMVKAAGDCFELLDLVENVTQD